MDETPLLILRGSLKLYFKTFNLSNLTFRLKLAILWPKLQ
jgi:hypothetical protein